MAYTANDEFRYDFSLAIFRSRVAYMCSLTSRLVCFFLDDSFFSFGTILALAFLLYALKISSEVFYGMTNITRLISRDILFIKIKVGLHMTVSISLCRPKKEYMTCSGY